MVIHKTLKEKKRIFLLNVEGLSSCGGSITDSTAKNGREDPTCCAGPVRQICGSPRLPDTQWPLFMVPGATQHALTQVLFLLLRLAFLPKSHGLLLHFIQVAAQDSPYFIAY
jgi:hypothetical protein